MSERTKFTPRDMQEVDSGESCDRCGNSVLIYTTVPQTKAKAEGWDWIANDGDPVRCCECGLNGHVSCDGEGSAWIAQDDDWDGEVDG